MLIGNCQHRTKRPNFRRWPRVHQVDWETESKMNKSSGDYVVRLVRRSRDNHRVLNLMKEDVDQNALEQMDWPCEVNRSNGKWMLNLW